MRKNRAATLYNGRQLVQLVCLTNVKKARITYKISVGLLCSTDSRLHRRFEDRKVSKEISNVLQNSSSSTIVSIATQLMLEDLNELVM